MGETITRPRALVTGASSGIGEAFARHLAQRRIDLVLVARRKKRLEDLADELAKEHEVAVDIIVADLAKESDLAVVEERLRSEGFDVLVNNAGIGTVGEFADLAPNREVEQLDVNVRAMMLLSHVALKSMIQRKRKNRGAILNVASMAAFQPTPYMATYGATKAFVLHFSEALHEEAKRHGVTVTCLCPGPVRTEFQEIAQQKRDWGPAVAWMSADAVVEAGLSAMSSGQAIMVPGMLNVVTSAILPRFLPRSLVRRISGWIMRNTRSN